MAPIGSRSLTAVAGSANYVVDLNGIDNSFWDRMKRCYTDKEIVELSHDFDFDGMLDQVSYFPIGERDPRHQDH